MPTELTDGVWWLDLGSVNAYLVDDDGALTLVDAGTPWSAADLVDGVVEAGFALGDLDRVLLTHYDLDHVGALARLDGLGLDLYAGAGDAPLVAGRQSPGFGSLKCAAQTLTGALRTAPSTPVQPLSDGDAVGSFAVHATPGHTAGHVCYVSEAADAAFLGDLVRERDGQFEPSPWFISEDVDSVRRSVRSLAGAIPDVSVAAPGHGVPFRERGARRLRDLADRL